MSTPVRPLDVITNAFRQEYENLRTRLRAGLRERREGITQTIARMEKELADAQRTVTDHPAAIERLKKVDAAVQQAVLPSFQDFCDFVCATNPHVDHTSAPEGDPAE